MGVFIRDFRDDPPRSGTAVIIDVVRFSTTVCALLQRRRSTVLAADTPRDLAAIPGLHGHDVFSELDFTGHDRRFDNSPVKALALAATRPAALCTTTGSRALLASMRASQVLIGCFANFHKIARTLKTATGDIHLIPAAWPTRSNPDASEDLECARAWKQLLETGKDTAGQRIGKIATSARVAQFLAFRPDNISDLCYCLGLDNLPVLPQAHTLADARGLAVIVRR